MLVIPNWTVNPTAASASHRSGDDPETDSVQEHALAPFRAGAPAGGGLTPGPPCAGARARALT